MPEEMRKAMDELRTDTNDVTGTTEPRPTDEEVAVAVSTLSKHSFPKTSRYSRPGWIAYIGLSLCVLLAGSGFLILFRQAQTDRIAQCERVNTLRARLANTAILAEANVPAPEYTKEVRDLYTTALDDLALTDCSRLGKKPGTTPKIIQRPTRELGQPSPPIPGMIGPQGSIGLTGPQGIPGLLGSTGPPGPSGPPGASIQGPVGAPGAKGPPGPIGPQGPNGPTGPMGSQGSIGSQGPIGPQGPSGMTVIPPPPPPTTVIPPPTTVLPPPTTTPTTICTNLLGLGCP